jgi:hypothetical protein
MLRRFITCIAAALLAPGLLALVSCGGQPGANGAQGPGGAQGPSGQQGPGGAQGGANVWRFQQVVVVNKANQYVTVVSDSHGASGGQVRIAVDGAALGMCPNGQEQMDFTWQFTRDIGQLANGDVVPAQITANIASTSPPCHGDIAGISDITFRQSGGVTYPLSGPLDAQADHDRVVPATPSPGVSWVRANDGPHERQAAVAFTRDPINPNRNVAYFWFDVGLRGGGDVYWVYVYQLVQ